VPFILSRIRKEEAGPVLLPGNAVLLCGKRTFPEDVFVRAVPGEVEPSEELVPAGTALSIEPEDLFFMRSATLFLPVDAAWRADRRVGLFRRLRSGGWAWVGALREGGRVGGRISHCSTYAAMADTVPPEVVSLRPRRGARERRARPLLSAKLRDRGSGVDWDSVYLTIDGKRLITAWEADAGAVWARPETRLRRGWHRAVVYASDRAGNSVNAATSFRVVR